MKRTPLVRRSPLKPGTKPLRAKKRIRARNPERAAKRFRQTFHSEAFVEWVHSLGCCIGGCGSTEIQAAHVRSRGAGGTWEDVAPLCVHHHLLQHEMGTKRFEAHYGVSLEGVAAATALRWKAFTRTED